jgi:uncharacterized protein YodC (DUF2158 family)
MDLYEVALGQLVALKSGGPAMTVETVSEVVTCLWFEGGALRGGTFRASSLVALPVPPGGANATASS